MSSGKSLGLVIENSEMFSPNVLNEGTYKPTIGTFGMYANKSIEGLWTYNPNSSTTWSY
jgi:hypothetical protein